MAKSTRKTKTVRKNRNTRRNRRKQYGGACNMSVCNTRTRDNNTQPHAWGKEYFDGMYLTKKCRRCNCYARYIGDGWQTE